MKKILAFFAVLFLTSCIDVEDFGGYWNVATVDPALAGRWRKVESGKHDMHEWIFTEKDGSYEIQLLDNGKADEDGPLYPVRTLVIGPHKFAVNNPNKGSMVRYRLSGNRVTFYVLNGEKAWTFITENYPKHANVIHTKADNENTVKIKKLDDETFNIIANIPSTEGYWRKDTVLEKLP